MAGSSMDMAIKLPLEEMVSKTAIDSTSLPNSVLTRQQADRFIDLVVNTSMLLKKLRVRKVDHEKGEINKLDLGNIVTEGAYTTSKATTHHPSERVVKYDLEKYRSAFDLKADFLENNIEKGAARDKILGMFTKRISIDTEMAAIQGDDDLPTGDDQSVSNNLLGCNDGFSKIFRERVPSAQQIDAAGAAPSKLLYYEMKRRIPTRYRVAKPSYRFILPSGPADKLMLDWSDRETARGDESLSEGTQPNIWGVRWDEIPLMPEDMSYGSAGTDGSEIWLTPYENMLYFIQREITIEFERVPRQDGWEATIHFKVDFEIENEDLCVIATNVAISGADYAP